MKTHCWSQSRLIESNHGSETEIMTPGALRGRGCMLKSRSLNSCRRFKPDEKNLGIAGGWYRKIPQDAGDIWVPKCWNEHREELYHLKAVLGNPGMKAVIQTNIFPYSKKVLDAMNAEFEKFLVGGETLNEAIANRQSGQWYHSRKQMKKGGDGCPLFYPVRLRDCPWSHCQITITIWKRDWWSRFIRRSVATNCHCPEFLPHSSNHCAWWTYCCYWSAWRNKNI